MKKYLIGFLVFVFVLSSVAYTVEIPWFDPPDEDNRLKYEEEADKFWAEWIRIEKNRREPIDAIENLTNEIKLLREAVERIEKKMPNSSVVKKASIFPPKKPFGPNPAGRRSW
jgi:hypothetical protein